ncbi:MAG: hypothetical protein H6Q13_1394 [Bacteroidetes bacterium]|nr:hypothetical protein [Bacteroidota bacterium]
MGTKERFVEYLKSKGVGQTAFEESAGLSRGAIAKKTGFSADSLEKIATTCPDLNINWLVTGTGRMINEDTLITEITDSPTSNKDIKILDIRVCAGHGIGFDGDENKVIGYVNIPEFTGCYGITVYGDSMYDMYMSGDTIFVREIKDKTLIDNGQPYVVITQEDRLLKMVYIESGGLKLVSFNPICNPDGRRKYPDMEIEGSRILHLYKVVGKLARMQM